MSSDLNDPTGVNHYVAPAATTTLVVDAVRVDEKPSNLWSDAWRDLRRRPVFWVSLLVVAIVLILLGVFVEAAKFLLWIGLVILIIAIIAWLMRVVKRNA